MRLQWTSPSGYPVEALISIDVAVRVQTNVRKPDRPWFLDTCGPQVGRAIEQMLQSYEVGAFAAIARMDWNDDEEGLDV